MSESTQSHTYKKWSIRLCLTSFHFSSFAMSEVSKNVPKVSQPRGVRWCYTVYANEEAGQTVQQVAAYLEQFAQRYCKFLCQEIETCPTTGKNHVQGFLYLNNKTTRNNLQNMMTAEPYALKGPHLEIARGKVQDNITYCSKEYVKDPQNVYFFQHGEESDIPSGPGARTDVKLLFDQHKSYNDAVSADPEACIRCRNVLHDLYRIRDANTHGELKRRVFWFYGTAGTGKTVSAQSYLNGQYGDNWCRQAGPIKWWPSYIGQPAILYDDFRRDCLVDGFGFAWLLNLLDDWPIMLEIKGGHILCQAECVIITCAASPVDLFTYHKQDGTTFIDERIDQLVRRIERILEFKRSPDLEHPESIVIDRTEYEYRRVGIRPGWSKTAGYKPADLTNILDPGSPSQSDGAEGTGTSQHGEDYQSQ